MHMIPTAEHHFSLISNLSSIALFSVKPWPYQHYVVHLSHPVSSMNTSILGSQMDNSSKNCSLSSSLLCLALNVSFFQVNPALCKKCGVHVAIHRSVPVVCSKYCWTSLRWIDGLSKTSGIANSSWAMSFLKRDSWYPWMLHTLPVSSNNFTVLQTVGQHSSS